jgi:4-hydroxy-3-polyprenylbenzoate decarboxylase
MKITVAITGASGVIIGIRLLEELVKDKHTVYGIITKNARLVLTHEIEEKYDLPSNVQYFEEDDQYSELNSSSFLLDAMVIAPCSLKSLAAIANGYTNTLVVRAAENVLRTGSKLIVVPRETPLSASALENMLRLKNQGAIVCPPIVAYYHQPQNVNDITNFFVGKILDLLGIENTLYNRWNGKN